VIVPLLAFAPTLKRWIAIVPLTAGETGAAGEKTVGHVRAVSSHPGPSLALSAGAARVPQMHISATATMADLQV
jgi:hypothetical protein